MPTLKVQPLKKGRLLRTYAVLVVLLLLAILPNARPAHALDPFYVITTADEHDLFPGDGQCVSNLTSLCTLRAAVEEVNVSGSRNIILPEGTFLLTLGYLAITGTPTITGAGAGRTILDGNGTNRAFDIAAGAFTYIGDLSIQHGMGSVGYVGHSHGGGIHNHGRLILVDVTISDSSAPTGWGGGGITNAGTGVATLENVTLTSNSTSANGGGIENLGSLQMYSSTISNNSAAQGGGISNFSGNPATLKNTIVANNPSGGNCAGTITSAGHNLDSDNTCGFANSGDLINTNPLLAAINWSTGTRALQPGSPAIDAGTNTDCPGHDERGVTRPKDGNNNGLATCDIGAYEFVIPIVQFDSSSYSVNEGTGIATVRLVLSDPSESGVTVDYATSDGTARAGSDYSRDHGTLTFAGGQTETWFSVFITDDSHDEPNETFNLRLSNPSGATLGAPSNTTIIIVDNDPAPAPNWPVHLPLVVRLP